MMNKSYDDVIRVTLPAPVGGVKSGGFYKIGLLFGCSVSTEAAGKLFTLERSGIYAADVEAAAGNEITIGEPLYWTAGRADAEFTNVAEAGSLHVGWSAGNVAAGAVGAIDVIIEPTGAITLAA